MKNIPIAKPSLTEEDINSVLEPLKKGWLVQGPKVSEFENLWSKYTEVEHSIAVTSCTSALYLSLVALGFKKGDEAIVPAFTWISTANVVEHLGGKVIFCDIDLKTFNINPEKIEQLITNKTKVILPVHLFGLAAEMTKIKNLAQKYNLYIVEDAACALGSKINNQHVGKLGNTACYSFHPRKAITTGEGGMISTNDSHLAKRLRMLRDHGASLNDLQRHLGPQPYLLADHTEAGYNLRMTDIQAALGASQMKRAESIINERQKLAQIYNSSFSNITWLQKPEAVKGFTHSFQSYPCIFDIEEVISAIKKKDHKALDSIRKRRNTWMSNLLNKGINTRPATHAVHMLSYYQNKYKIKPEDYPCAQAANDCSISLPLFNGMTVEEQNQVITAVKETSK